MGIDSEFTRVVTVTANYPTIICLIMAIGYYFLTSILVRSGTLLHISLHFHNRSIYFTLLA